MKRKTGFYPANYQKKLPHKATLRMIRTRKRRNLKKNYKTLFA